MSERRLSECLFVQPEDVSQATSKSYQRRGGSRPESIVDPGERLSKFARKTLRRQVRMRIRRSGPVQLRIRSARRSPSEPRLSCALDARRNTGHLDRAPCTFRMRRSPICATFNPQSSFNVVRALRKRTAGDPFHQWQPHHVRRPRTVLPRSVPADIEVFDEAQILTIKALINLILTRNARIQMIVFAGNPAKAGRSMREASRRN